jgi:3',5'-cyclic-nucleotide phosphodiesterase
VFDPQQSKKVWALFIRIILSTDMANHFELVKKAQADLDEGSFDLRDPEFRQLGLLLIMKVGDISNVSRPFELADKWCDILNEEFFHQGDLEKESGIGLTSPLNDRDKANKPKSQIGFYNFICLPLYTVLSNLFPPLEVLLNSVKANLEKWKDLVAAQTSP